MIGFTKAEQVEFDKLTVALAVADGVLQGAVVAFNEAVNVAFQALTEAAAVRDGARRPVIDYVAARIREWEDEFEGKSEKWQEGEKGDAAQQFIDAWKEWPEREDLDLWKPDPVDEYEFIDANDAFDDQPEYQPEA